MEDHAHRGDKVRVDGVVVEGTSTIDESMLIGEPLAAAVVNGAHERDVALVGVTGFASLTGRGVRGTVDRHGVALGNQRMLDELGVEAGALGASVSSVTVIANALRLKRVSL